MAIADGEQGPGHDHELCEPNAEALKLARETVGLEQHTKACEAWCTGRGTISPTAFRSTIRRLHLAAEQFRGRCGRDHRICLPEQCTALRGISFGK